MPNINIVAEKNLDRLIRTMQPVLNNGDYVFCTTTNLGQLDFQDVVLTFKEQEGLTVVVKREIADRLNLSYTFISSWITLQVHSSLEAVGLTAAFSTALSEHSISCNVIAGYYHDHIFVDKKDAEKALMVLKALSEG